ncbi:MAG: SUMF1/EgtB/PvdO family nonheme iron enzyme [Verrucomicrobia bacterium]|nr:SUMF1/EgtB/PvdO family nonheme iron enzyme [Verrucomicrobiota bacterium]
MAELTGQTFAGYEILAKLGQGGMGAVYKARQPVLNRLVALKVMSPHLSDDPAFVARFMREATSAAKLNHANMVLVHTAGQRDGAYYIVMEFVDGLSLQDHIANHGRLDAREAVATTVYVAQALQYAWDKARLIHRDIKPANIFLSNAGEVKVGDLGLAKSVGQSTESLTQTGMMMGSPHYIAPEQARGLKDIDFRADIYSLGCTLYHMLTGHPPYTGEDSMAIMMKHVNDPPPAIFRALPGCPVPLGMLVGKMLAKRRSDRPQSYEDLIADLMEVHGKLPAVGGPRPTEASARPAAVNAQVAAQQAREGARVQTPAVATPTVPMTRKKTSPAMIYGIAGAVAVAMLGGLFLWSPWKSDSSSILNPKSKTQNFGAAAAAALKQLGNVFTNSVGAEMVYIPPGEFLLGSTKEEQAWAEANGMSERLLREGEGPRKARIKQGFWMGRTTVTVGQWKQFVKETGYVTKAEEKGEASAWDVVKKKYAPRKGINWRDPGFGFALNDTHPVCCISWNDAVAFCEWLTERERKAGHLPAAFVVRLPTEAEWEYACRAGTQTKYWWGDNKEDGKGRLNWFAKGNGYKSVAPVDSFGERGRNRFGLADMLGNVRQYCLDRYDAEAAHEELWNDFTRSHVMRGSSFRNGYAFCRCASRAMASPSNICEDYSFRVVLGVDVSDAKASTPSDSSAAKPAESNILAPAGTVR